MQNDGTFDKKENDNNVATILWISSLLAIF